MCKKGELEMNSQIYEKVNKICERIDSYTEKDYSIKNEVKTTSYITKIKKLINMIENAENSTYKVKDNLERENIDNNIEDNKYNPYNKDFYYKDRLEQLDGDIYELIHQLKEEDKIGHRNAYVINEIKKYINTNERRGRKKENNSLSVKENISWWNKIKRFFHRR